MSDGEITQIDLIDRDKTKTYSAHKRLLHQESPYFATLPNSRKGKIRSLPLHSVLSYPDPLQFLKETPYPYLFRFFAAFSDSLTLSTSTSPVLCLREVRVG